MAKGMRMRLISQSVIFAQANADAFIEAGVIDDRPPKVPYDADMVRRIVKKGTVM